MSLGSSAMRTRRSPSGSTPTSSRHATNADRTRAALGFSCVEIDRKENGVVEQLIVITERARRKTQHGLHP